MHLPYFLILKNEIYQLNYICIQSNPRKKITGGFIHKFLANYVSLSVLWDITLTIYQHICLHSHFTSYRYWERFFFNDVTLFTFLSLFKRKIILPLRWIELNIPNVVGTKGVNHTQIHKSVAAQIFSGSADQKWKGTGLPLLQFAGKWVQHSLRCVFALCGSAGILSQHPGDVCGHHILEQSWSQNRISAPEGKQLQGVLPGMLFSFVLVSAGWGQYEKRDLKLSVLLENSDTKAFP